VLKVRVGVATNCQYSLLVVPFTLCCYGVLQYSVDYFTSSLIDALSEAVTPKVAMGLASE